MKIIDLGVRLFPESLQTGDALQGVKDLSFLKYRKGFWKDYYVFRVKPRKIRQAYAISCGQNEPVTFS